MKKLLRKLNIFRTLNDLRKEIETLKVEKKLNEKSDVKMVAADKRQGKTGMFLPLDEKLRIDAEYAKRVKKEQEKQMYS